MKIQIEIKPCGNYCTDSCEYFSLSSSVHMRICVLFDSWLYISNDDINYKRCGKCLNSKMVKS